MDAPSTTHLWAQHLLRVEAGYPSASEENPHEAVRVCEKLRLSLTRFVGPDGFAALSRRALALARAEAPVLQAVQISLDGRLDGLQAVVANGAKGVEAAIALTAHLLRLLVVFIGVPMTRRLVGEIWPEAWLED